MVIDANQLDFWSGHSGTKLALTLLSVLDGSAISKE
jgi:hypothetical protein